MISNNKKTVVFGVVFPENEAFMGDYLSSLAKQTFSDFDLVIINDGYAGFDRFKGKYALDIIELPASGTMAGIREFGLKYIRRAGYEHAIFTDSDDYFQPNRVEKCLELLMDSDIVVNDLITVTASGKTIEEGYISNRLKDLSKVDIDFVTDKNIFGFSNTAIKVKCIPDKVRFASDVIAVDWAFFTTLLDNGCDAVFTNQTATFYRMHGRNFVGLSADISPERMERAVSAKAIHYKELSRIDRNFKRLYDDFSKLRDAMADDGYKKRYAEMMKKLNQNSPLWWEEAKIPEGAGI